MLHYTDFTAHTMNQFIVWYVTTIRQPNYTWATYLTFLWAKEGWNEWTLCAYVCVRSNARYITMQTANSGKYIRKFLNSFAIEHRAHWRWGRSFFQMLKTEGVYHIYTFKQRWIPNVLRATASASASNAYGYTYCI